MSHLLLVHGFPLDSRMWRAQVEGLAGVRTVLAPDLAGHGADRSAPATSLDGMARHLAGVLDAAGIDAVDLGGLSMGGYVVFAFLRLFPERVRSLALIDTRPGADTEAGRAGRDALAAAIREHGAAAARDAMLPKMFAGPASEAVRAETERMMLEQPPGTLVADVLAMRDRPDSTPDLAGIAVPTLVVVGAGDVITPPAEAEAMVAAIPGARLELIPGAGHLAPVEQPDAVNAALRRFLS
ncbi:MAG TPA: alpha/beta fold hydrolase [Candidatus Dormibacteraeota bacterium]|nr:alpha/beta fold hydrolase [Candidatus Dormibacteraeota bacterium]